MSELVGFSPCPAISTPQRNDPLDADVVRGNDNTIGTAYNAHQSDPGIHVQSSDLSARPAATTAGVGAKWINKDTAANTPRRLWYSDGSAWYEVSSSQAIIDGTAAAPGMAFSQDTDTGMYRPTTNVLGLTTAGVERARFTASGALLVNTAVAYAAEFACISHSTAASSPIASWNKDTTGDNYFATFVTEGGGGTLRGSIQYNRGAGQVAYNITSDERLKENIADAADAGALVDALQVRQFDWKETGNHLDYGFVAQELHTVVPHAVTVPEDSAAMWSVDYSKLVPMLVKEVQALRARVAALENV